MALTHLKKPEASRYFLLVLFLFIFAGCAETAPPPPPEPLDTGVSPSGSAPPPSIFPHPVGWASPASHGVSVFQYGSTTCLKCHKAASNQPESTPTCASCHPLFPHKPDWVKKENHGGEVLANGIASCATQCHGSDLKGGLSGVSCDTCHTIYPHTTDWAAPSIHGAAAEGSGKSVCQGCHGSDLLGGDTGVSCKQCHTLYPHVSNWSQPDQHGNYVINNGNSSCATQCHGVDLKGGLSSVACNSCHDLYPHINPPWGTTHGATVEILGKTACQGCHGSDYKTLLGGQNCFSCHPDYPHAEPSTWLPYTGGHGQKVQSTYAGSTASCLPCHGSDLKTLKPDGNNCFSCHPAYPHEKLSPPDWGTYEGHGQYALPSTKKPECQLCHGADYNGGVRSNPSCYSCHPAYPHAQTGWLQAPGQPQGHGNFVNAYSSTSCATARCHGIGFVPTPGITNGPQCTSCHATFPHVPGWSSGTIHGPIALANIDVCKTCHGSGLDKAPTGYQSCAQCHPSYLQHPSAELGVTGWGTYTGHGQYILNPPLSGDMSSCQLCHGADYLGGISLISCKSCHASFPHTDVNWDTGSGHGNYVKTTLGGNLTSCKVCHGNDLKGGHSGVSCNTCHPNYPHSVIANWSTTAHGPKALSLADREGCKDCHGTDLLGGTSGVSCKSCHTEFPHSAAWVQKQTETKLVSSTCCNPEDEFDCWPCTISTTVDNMFLHGQRFVEQKNAGFPDSPNRCRNCHGTNYSTLLNGKSCMTCHNDYPHVKYSNWKTTPTSTPLGGQHTVSYLSGAAGLASPCTACHINLGKGLDPIGGIGGAALSCNACHSYPHLRPPDVSATSDWLAPAAAPGSPINKYHGYKFLLETFVESPSDPNECKFCHGNNLLGMGSTAKNCAGCHQHFGKVSHESCCRVTSHPGSPWRQTANHGKVYLDALAEGTSFSSRCGRCHDSGTKRDPKACNPYAGNKDACNICHKAPVPACSVALCAWKFPAKPGECL